MRIEYLMSLLKEAEYPLIIVALEEVIEIRLKDKPPVKTVMHGKHSANSAKPKK